MTSGNDPDQSQATALAAMGAARLDEWRAVMESLSGWVQVAVEHGWLEPVARQMVLAQYQANLQLTVLAAQTQQQGLT